MKVIIVEDEHLAAKRLERLICELRPQWKIQAKADSISSAVEAIQKYDPELLFLDIQLSDGLSFSIAEKVNIQCPVIFTTAFDEYALKAFELQAVDYLLKPIELEALSSALEKMEKMGKSLAAKEEQPDWNSLLQHLHRKKNFKNRFLLKRGDQLIPLDVSAIAYFKAEDKAVYAITSNKEQHLMDQSLSELEQLLDPEKFFRLNRKFLASVDAIAKVSTYFHGKIKIKLVPETDTEVIISSEKAAEFKEWFGG